MSTRAEILDVHETESKFKLRPHQAPITQVLTIETRGLRVRLRDLISPKAYQMLKDMGLLP